MGTQPRPPPPPADLLTQANPSPREGQRAAGRGGDGDPQSPHLLPGQGGSWRPAPTAMPSPQPPLAAFTPNPWSLPRPLLPPKLGLRAGEEVGQAGAAGLERVREGPAEGPAEGVGGLDAGPAFPEGLALQPPFSMRLRKASIPSSPSRRPGGSKDAWPPCGAGAGSP